MIYCSESSYVPVRCRLSGGREEVWWRGEQEWLGVPNVFFTLLPQADSTSLPFSSVKIEKRSGLREHSGWEFATVIIKKSS